MSRNKPTNQARKVENHAKYLPAPAFYFFFNKIYLICLTRF